MGAEADFPRTQHAWARFSPGSWKLVRVFTDTFDPTGNLNSTIVTETKTSLVDVTSDSYTLRVESITEVAGKRIAARPAEMKQRFNGAMEGQTGERRPLPGGQLIIDGKTYSCRVQQFEVKGQTGRTLTKTYYSDVIDPYVLRRESTIFDAANKETGRSILQVTSLGKAYPVLSDTLNTACVQLISTHGRGKEETQAINAVDVPGGIVAHESREWNTANQLVSHSRLELVDYQACHEGIDTRDARRFRLLRRPRLRDGLRPTSFYSDGLPIFRLDGR